MRWHFSVRAPRRCRPLSSSPSLCASLKPTGWVSTPGSSPLSGPSPSSGCQCKLLPIINVFLQPAGRRGERTKEASGADVTWENGARGAAGGGHQGAIATSDPCSVPRRTEMHLRVAVGSLVTNSVCSSLSVSIAQRETAAARADYGAPKAPRKRQQTRVWREGWSYRGHHHR